MMFDGIGKGSRPLDNFFWIPDVTHFGLSIARLTTVTVTHFIIRRSPLVHSARFPQLLQQERLGYSSSSRQHSKRNSDTKIRRGPGFIHSFIHSFPFGHAIQYTIESVKIDRSITSLQTTISIMCKSDNASSINNVDNTSHADSLSTTSTDSSEEQHLTHSTATNDDDHHITHTDDDDDDMTQQQQSMGVSWWSPVVWIRRGRPYAAGATLMAYALYRSYYYYYYHYQEQDDNNTPSLLQLLVHTLTRAREMVLDYTRRNSSSPHRLVSHLWTLMEDALAFLAVATWIRAIYVVCHYSWNNDYREKVSTSLLQLAQTYIPAVQQKIDQQTNDTVAKGDEMLNKDPQRTLTLALPTHGRPTTNVLEELETFAQNEDKHWSTGQISGTVYHALAETDHNELMNRVYKAYAWSNPLHPGIWPKIGQCEGEVISMTGNMLHAPSNIGCLTSGGTESILLAIRAHLQYYGKQRSIQYPELICGSTAHAAVDKACDIYNIRKVVVDCSQYGHALNPAAVRRLVTSNTIMIYASSPTYPQGVIDPIEDLSRVAQEFDIGLHVDACLGGFVLPFLKDSEISVPIFDFRNPGVTSMSADTHKFGNASKGTSVVLYRHTELRHGQYFCYPHWTGGLYTTPTFAGSRAGALSACAWAAMVSLGEDGYRKRALAIARAARALASGILEIDGLELLTKRPYMVVCFTAQNDDEFCIYRVQDMMKSKGWALNAMQKPASIHICITANVVPRISDLLRDLEIAVVEAKKEGTAGLKKGTAGIYGTVGSVPAGAILPTLRAFTDLTLAP